MSSRSSMHCIAGATLVACAAAISASASASAPAPPSTAPRFPMYPEQFYVRTREYSSAGVMTLNQTLAWDTAKPRTLMSADGASGNSLEQITRCDADPAYFFNAARGAVGDGWTCSNQTLDAGSCPVSDFWVEPLHSQWQGNETVDGVECGRWDWWDAGVRVHYAFWGTDDAPCATAQLLDDGTFAWSIHFDDFVAGPPPDEAFAASEGVVCPPDARRASGGSGPSGPLAQGQAVPAAVGAGRGRGMVAVLRSWSSGE